MINLISFEIKKFFSRKKNLISILLFIALCTVFIGLNSSLEAQYIQSEKSSINYDMDSVNKALKDSQQAKIDFPNLSAPDNDIASYKEQLRLLTEKRDGYISNDTQKYLKASIQLDKNLLKGIKSGTILSPSQSEDSINKTIELNTLLLNKNIKPIFTTVSMKSFNFVTLFLNLPFSLIIVILLILLSADMLSSEFDLNTYKLLFTQPVSRVKIILSRVISSIIITTLIIIALLTIAFISLAMLCGMGSIDYPMQFYNNNSDTFITVGKFILLELILLLFIIIFVCILSILISAITKNTSSSISSTIIISISLYMISNKGLLGKLSYLNPFTYVDLSKVLNGSSSMLCKDPNIDFTHGLLILAVFSILLLIINIVYSKRNLCQTK